MKVSSHHQHRITRLLTVALAVAALAAPTASAMPAPVDQPQEVVIEPAPVVQTVDGGLDWDSAAIGAGGAGALLLLVSLGGFTYRSRHHDMRINH
ncbi:MAG TPA: hypothetical protein VEX67_02310 [Solirubrobacteraceae bacterium]|nr:hypothetical protein [Solirubrobacteraceae bacterium]